MIPTTAIIEAVAQASGLVVALIGTVVGAVATIFIQAFLPDNWKLRIRYHASHWRKRLGEDLTFQTKLVRSYDTVENDVRLYDLSSELWEEFGVQATGMNDHFEFTETRQGQDFDVDVRLFHEEDSSPGLGYGRTDTTHLETDGGEEPERVVTSVRIEVESNLPYSNLKGLLVRGYDLLRDTDSAIPVNLDGGTYALSCEQGKPPEINLLLSEFTEVKTSRGDIELEYRDGKLTARNYEDGAVDEMIDIIYKLATLYS